MENYDVIDSILSLYNYEVPLTVANYILYIYNDKIVCNLPLNYDYLIGNFIDYKNYVKFYFNKINSNSYDYDFIKLTYVELSTLHNDLANLENIISKFKNYNIYKEIELITDYCKCECFIRITF